MSIYIYIVLAIVLIIIIGVIYYMSQNSSPTIPTNPTNSSPPPPPAPAPAPAPEEVKVEPQLPKAPASSQIFSMKWNNQMCVTPQGGVAKPQTQAILYGDYCKEDHLKHKLENEKLVNLATGNCIRLNQNSQFIYDTCDSGNAFKLVQVPSNHPTIIRHHIQHADSNKCLKNVNNSLELGDCQVDDSSTQFALEFF